MPPPVGQDCYKILLAAERKCLSPEFPIGKPKRRRLKRSKSRNLLERLIGYEDDMLRFMTNTLMPITNNLGENDFRMSQMQQKISDSFSGMTMVRVSCRIEATIDQLLTGY